MVPTLTLLGTGDALGVPRVYCTCSVCTEARTTGANRRSRPSALIRTPEGETVLLDCSPDWRGQMEAAGLRSVGTVLLTHAHHDHIGGLPDLADALRWTGATARVLGPEPVLQEVARRYPWLERHLEWVPLTGPAHLAGFQIEAWEVNHGKNGRSHGYRLERPGYAWAYLPDSIHLSPAEQAPLRGLDLLVLGTAYYQEAAPLATRSLYDMTEALGLLAAVTPRHTLFTHLSHGVDCRAAYPLPPGVQIGRDGLTVPLG